MAAYAALVSLYNTLDQINTHPRFSNSLNKYQIQYQFLGQKIDFFLNFVENYSCCGGIIINKEAVEELERQITCAAQDVIESHIVNQILPGSTETNSDARLHKKCFFGLQRVFQHMNSIKDEVLKVQEEYQIPPNSTAPLVTAEKSSSMVGFDECPDELMGIGKKIVERCKGLPLSIFVIGGLLRKSHRIVEYWKNVERNINSVLNSRENGQCLDALYLSYSHLPAHLKPCFLYMGVYREDYKIRVSKMIKLWVAGEFLKPNGVQMLEVIANDYVKDLIDRNLILVCENGSNGKVKSCRMHDLVRDLCLRVASKEKFFSVVMANSIPGGIDRERRLTFHDDNSVYDVLPSSSIARSMICNQVVIIPPKCRLLRVLSSEVVADCIETEFHNFNLRCLDFLVPQTNSKLLPSSISRIWNLQTLIICKIWSLFGSRISNNGLNNVSFPSSINKLTDIIHWQDLSMITASLPQLQVLKLSILCVEGGFPYSSLESSLCFPVLEKLVLMYLSYLKAIPLEFWEVPNLERIQQRKLMKNRRVMGMMILFFKF